MKRFLKSRRLQVLAVLAVFSFGAWAVPNIRDKQEVAKMTEKMKTVCVGRFLIDLPEKAQYSVDHGEIDGFSVSTALESEEAFTARVNAREAEIRAEPDHLGGNKNMESVKEVRTGGGLVGKIFVFGREITDGVAGYGANQEHYHYENVAVEGYVHANGLSVDLTTDGYNPANIGNLSKLIAQIVPNPNNHIPTEPGFCIDQLFFRDPLRGDQRERVVMFAGVPDHPDMAIVFSTMAGTKPSEKGLLERSRIANADYTLLEQARIKDLFAGKRVINGMPGEQVLTRYTELSFTISHAFMWELKGTRDDVFRPFLTLELQSGVNPRAGGNPLPSSLSESALLDLWEKISSSLRVRPTESPKVSAAEPATPPLGTVAVAGDICPVSGWYQCSDGGNGVGVLGGQRQYIMQGQRVPQALLLPPQTLWEKLKGVQPSYESKARTAWLLVDKRSRKRIAPNVTLAQAVVASATTTGATAGALEPQAAVGTYVTTGKVCPASGWWRAEESHALDGTRWFAQGSVLPAATFNVPPGAFGKSATETQKTMQRRGTWMLVLLAQPAPEPAGAAGEVRRQNDDPGADAASASGAT
jgi:hypothetical protein